MELRRSMTVAECQDFAQGTESSVCDSPSTALPAERLHVVLRSMLEEDWFSLLSLMRHNVRPAAEEYEIAILERVFRKGEAISGQDGAVVLQAVQAILGNALLMAEVQRAHERVRT